MRGTESGQDDGLRESGLRRGLSEALKVCNLWQDKNKALYIGDFLLGQGLRIKVKVK